MSVKLNLDGVRIEKTEFFDGKNYTVVVAPAADSFSHPSRFKVTSLQVMGGQGQFLDLVVQVNGMVRTKTFPDKNTGQQRSYDDASVFFDVISFKPSVVATPQPIQSKSS